MTFKLTRRGYSRGVVELKGASYTIHDVYVFNKDGDTVCIENPYEDKDEFVFDCAVVRKLKEKFDVPAFIIKNQGMSYGDESRYDLYIANDVVGLERTNVEIKNFDYEEDYAVEEHYDSSIGLKTSIRHYPVELTNRFYRLMSDYDNYLKDLSLRELPKNLDEVVDKLREFTNEIIDLEEDKKNYKEELYNKVLAKPFV